jgi:predicted TIM-barrel fold metal-dependent hydrolase
MPVIDIDSHFEPADDWLDEFPALKAKLPARFPTDDPRFTLRSPEMFAFFVTDDLLRGVPREKRMPIERLVSPGIRKLYDTDRGPEVGYAGSDMHKPMVDVAERIGWLDQQGIDVQNVISGAAYTLARVIDDPALGMEALEAANTWLSDRTGELGGRLMTAVNLRFENLDWAIAEIGRMRDRGSRTLLISAEPIGDVPPNHPAYDRLWSAVTDLGMVPIVHVGLSPALYHPAWANTDDPALIRLISVLQMDQQAQVFLNAMVFGGVFERHPDLTVVFAEQGIDWVIPNVLRMDALAEPGFSPLVIDRYKLPLKPSEYVRRNVRVTPLPVAHQNPVPIIQGLPDVAVFSSDYPHMEGSPDPVGHYDKELASLSDDERSSFMGDSLAACFARMGDPLPVRTEASGD